MARTDKYYTNVQPNLDKIPKMLETMNEMQIAKALGIAKSSFENYKRQHPELREALAKGREGLVQELKDTLRKKAKGFYYTETKTTQRKENGKNVVVVEKYEKYAQPDTGAIHLLLKNYDDNWRNDDKATVDLKKEQLELAKQKQEDANW